MIIRTQTPKSVSAAAKMGAELGAAFEKELLDLAGGLVARWKPFIATLKKGAAAKAADNFLSAFQKAAPSASKLKRFGASAAELRRIAAGVDAGTVAAEKLNSAPWAELVAMGPKKQTGKGSGGGRKPRQPVAPVAAATAPKAAPAAPAAPVTAAPATVDRKQPAFAQFRQQLAALGAVAQTGKDELPGDLVAAVESLLRKTAAHAKKIDVLEGGDWTTKK